jgi:signal transduction histidine kinase
VSVSASGTIDTGFVTVGRRLRAADARHPLVADAALTAAAALLGAVAVSDGSFDATIRPEIPPAPAAVPWALLVGFTLCLLWRRTHPLGALWAVVAGCNVMAWWGLDHPAVLGAFVVLYSAGRRMPTGMLAWACGGYLAGTVASAGRWGFGAVADGYVPLLVLLVGSALLGITVQTRRDYVARLEVERDQRARLAVAAERARIAREMHDIVAHNLAVIVALADGAAYSFADAPQRAQELVDKVSASGREALGDMRRLVGVLRDDDTPTVGPQPGLAEIDALVEQVRAAGMDVTLTRAGAPREWGPSAGLTVYRILQEALTNTMKHAGPRARTRVTLSFTAAGVDLDVTDDGARRPPHAAPHPESRPESRPGGHGLAGMTERAASYGGHVDAGPLPGAAGWRVHAHLPFGTGGTA